MKNLNKSNWQQEHSQIKNNTAKLTITETQSN